MGRDVIQEALEHFQIGRLPDAQNLCQQLLMEKPDHAGALQLLGLIVSARGDHTTAIELMRRSVMAAPAIADFQNNLGEALWNAGKFKEAGAYYRTALRLNP